MIKGVGCWGQLRPRNIYRAPAALQCPRFSLKENVMKFRSVGRSKALAVSPPGRAHVPSAGRWVCAPRSPALTISQPLITRMFDGFRPFWSWHSSQSPFDLWFCFLPFRIPWPHTCGSVGSQAARTFSLHSWEAIWILGWVWLGHFLTCTTYLFTLFCIICHPRLAPSTYRELSSYK